MQKIHFSHYFVIKYKKIFLRLNLKMRGICDKSEFKILGNQKSLRRYSTKPSAKTSSQEVNDSGSEFEISSDADF